MERSRLIACLLAKTGTSLVDSKACSDISVRIFLETDEYVSRTNIERLLGISPSTSELSPWTLTAIERYVKC